MLFCVKNHEQIDGLLTFFTQAGPLVHQYVVVVSMHY